MKRLPNGDRAFVDILKLEQYCLSDKHPRGKHKARVFSSALGLSRADATELKDKLAQIAKDEVAVEGSTDAYGTRYLIDFYWARGIQGATVRSCWMIRSKEDIPYFVTCFVMKVTP